MQRAPQAALLATLVALHPPLGAWDPRCQISFLTVARQPLDFGELQQAGRRERTRPFGMRSKACIDLAASAIKSCRRCLNWTSSGRATCRRKTESG